MRGENPAAVLLHPVPSSAAIVGKPEANKKGAKMYVTDIQTKLGNALLTGTSVLACDGDMPVEHLCPGDRVITRDTGVAILRNVQSLSARGSCVRIKAGSLGNTRPDRDVLLLASQQVLIRDWRARALFGKSQALVPASRLIDGAFVTDAGMRDVRLVQLIFETPHILYGDGLELASTSPVVAFA